MMLWYGGYDWWGYAAMGIGMALFWALLIGGIVALVRLTASGTVDRRQPSAPEQILAARYATGELTETEYRDRLTTLRM